MEKRAEKGIIVRQWGRIAGGLLIFALGVHLTILANIGLAPWDCLGMGLSFHTPLNYGLAMTVMSVLILMLDVGMGEKIGCGTIIDALSTGNFVQMFNWLAPFPPVSRPVAAVAVLMAGLALMALGQYFYMSAGQGCGPRDTLLIGLGKRLRRLPVGVVEIMLWAAVLFTGWLLGGPVGLGTLICTFGGGAVMQAVFSGLQFEPRTVQHRSVLEALRILRQN